MVAVQRFKARWYGFAVSRAPIKPDLPYWALATTAAGYRADLAGSEPVGDWADYATTLFGIHDCEISSIIDMSRGMARVALMKDGRVEAALFVSPEPVAVMRDYLATVPGMDVPDVLIGRPAADMPNPGPMLLFVFRGWGVNTIVQAIEEQGLITVDAVGACLAGRNQLRIVPPRNCGP